ncbi:secreted protein [Beggiatoa sp. PS]|nr:secreted protein [Beggiatoa sp. PS]
MKMKKLAVAVGMALSLGIVSQASAEMTAECCGARGDMLMFPAFIGASGYENYYAITNDANAWIQGHLRFRGAAWCGELLDFDVILSPGDVFVFRVADIDGDGDWDIDQSLDELNFQYTGLLETPDMGDSQYSNALQGRVLSTSHCTNNTDGSTTWKCMESNWGLIPTETDLVLTAGRIEYEKQVGYIQFFGEAVLKDMTHDIMPILLSGVPGNWEPYQTDVLSKRGTSAWKWSNAAGQFANFPPEPDSPWVGNRGLTDVPNVLAGVGFISTTGKPGLGVAFNATTFRNFRTENTNHRIDNYRVGKKNPDGSVGPDVFHMDIPRNADGTPTTIPVAQTGLLQPTSVPETVYRDGQPYQIVHAGSSKEDRAVMVHHEYAGSSPSGVSPFGDYVFGIDDNLTWEGDQATHNTWGPNLADGDDYTLPNVCTVGEGIDFGDSTETYSLTNSIAEVEEAIRLSAADMPKGRQDFGGYYFDGAAPGPNHQGYTALRSWFFAWFPTKIFYSQGVVFQGLSLEDRIFNMAKNLISKMPPKTYLTEVWNIKEETPNLSPGGGGIEFYECVSPATNCYDSIPYTYLEGSELPLSECLAVFDIGQVKKASVLTRFNSDGSVDTSTESVLAKFKNGRFKLNTKPGHNNPEICVNTPLEYAAYPAMMFSFEWGADNSLAHWRCLIR